MELDIYQTQKPPVIRTLAFCRLLCSLWLTEVVNKNAEFYINIYFGFIYLLAFLNEQERKIKQGLNFG